MDMKMMHGIRVKSSIYSTNKSVSHFKLFMICEFCCYFFSIVKFGQPNNKKIVSE